VESLIAANEEAVTTTVRNMETFTTALAENSDEVATFLSDAGAAARRLDSVGARLETLAGNLDGLVTAADPDAVRGIIADVETFAGRLDDVAQRVASLVEENEAAVSNTIRNAETFTAALAENSDAIASFMADAGAAARRLDSAGARIEALAGRAEEVVAAVEPDAIRAIVDDAQAFSRTLAANSQQITVFAENAGSAAERLNRLAGELDGVGERVAQVVGAVDPERVARSLENVETFTTSLAERSGDFESFMDDAGAVAAQLRQTSQRLDDLLVRVDGMVGEDGEGFMTDIAAAARSFRQLTENLDSRLDVILADIQRFGGGGLREFETFMGEGRRTLGNIERLINSLERDPSQVIFGGSRTPEYNPGRRF
jgi:phospholipid/cholesterol/gamma-HCH transport system substrate-binding protein